MSVRKELHILLRGVESLRVPGRSAEDSSKGFDTYCLITAGRQQHRSRTIEHTAGPQWNEEFVFDGSSIAPDEVVKLEVYHQGMFQDELLFYTFLELAYCANLEQQQQQGQQQQQQQHGTNSTSSSSSSSSSRRRGSSRSVFRQRGGSAGGSEQQGRCSLTDEDFETIQEGEQEGDSGSGSSSGASSSSSRIGDVQHQPNAATTAGVAAAHDRVTPPVPIVGRVSDVTTQHLALLSASNLSGATGSSSSGYGGGLLGGVGAASRSGFGSSRSAKSLAKIRLKRSTHVRSATDLVVCVWWVLQPVVDDTGVPPCVLSFVQPLGCPHSLPSSTHLDNASLWEEPCLAFVRLVVSRVCLGPAAAGHCGGGSSGGGRATTTAAAGVEDGGGSSDGGGGGSSSRQHQQQHHMHGVGGGLRSSKAVLRRLTGLLRGDPSAAEEVSAAAAALSSDDEAASAGRADGRPTLRDIHGAGGLSFRAQGSGGLDGAEGLTQWDWQALDELLLEEEEEDEEEEDAAAAAGRGQQQQHAGGDHHQQQQHHHTGGLLLRRSSSGGNSGRDSSSTSARDNHNKKSSSSSKPGKKQSSKSKNSDGRSSSSSDKDKKLHLLVRVQLGEQEVQTLKPVPLNPDGSASVCQAAVFAVLRPLEEAVITYQLGLCRGANTTPLLVLVFQYSLLHLLRRSPPHSYVWEEWKRIARATVSGLQVPLPVLPLAHLDLSAFLADADCRAGMYQVPAVSAAALAAAAADDAAAAAAAAAEAEAAAAAAAQAAAAADIDEALTDSEDVFDEDGGSSGSNTQQQQQQQRQPDVAYDYVEGSAGGAQGFSESQQQQSGFNKGAQAGVLRRRPAPGSAAAAAEQEAAAAAAAGGGSSSGGGGTGSGGGGGHQQQQQQAGGGKGGKHPQFDKWRSRVLSGVEAGLHQAMDKLPDNVAQKVKGNKFINKVFPRAQRSEVFAIGQLRVLSTNQDGRGGQHSTLQHASGGAGATAPYTSSSSAATPFKQAASQQQQQHDGSGGAVSASQQQPSMHRSVSAGLLSAKSSAEQAAAVAAAAAAAAKQAAAVVPLQDHPNVATAGDPAGGPLGVLQLTIQCINLRKGSLSAGYSLLLKCGPHWLTVAPAALPLHIYTSSSGSTTTVGGGSAVGGGAGGSVVGVGGSSSSSSAMVAGGGFQVEGLWGPGRGEAQQAPPLQVLIPVYGSSCLVALVLHRRNSVAGRCVFRLYGLLPLLLRDHHKSLVLYSDKRGAGGGRIVAGSVLIKLSAAPSPGSSRLGTLLRLAFSYLVTPHTLSLHTSGVLESMGRDQRAAAAGRVVSEWLHRQGQAVVPDALVRQLVSTGRTALSSRSMKGHVRRIKAVMLDWLPRRLDPLAFYYWRRPLHNLLALWVLSHACLHPGQWLMAVSLLFTLVMLRHMAIQIRHGVLGFEMEQLLPTDVLGASLADTLNQQQQQQLRGGSDDDTPVLSEWGCTSGDSGAEAARLELAHQLRGSGDGGGTGGGRGGGVGGVCEQQQQQLSERQKYKEAAERIRAKIAAGRNKLVHGPSSKSTSTASALAGGAKPPTSLAELREQLESGTLNLDALDIEAAAQQLLSVGGLLRLARKHSSYMLEYALVAQNLLDDAAGFAEGLYAMATAQDPLAALLLCAVLLGASGLCYVFGLGAGVFVLIAVLLRPPLLRGVPGVFGWKAILSQLRGHGRSLEELAW